MKKILSAAALFALPTLAFAQTGGGGGPVTSGPTPTNLLGLINLLGTVFNALIPILIALALVVFFWGLVKYIWKREGTEYLYAGLIGLFIMVSVWGIIRLAQNSLGVNNSTSIPVPQVSPNYVH